MLGAVVISLTATSACEHACCSKSRSAQYDGTPWHLKGAGIVCCPCRVPCPCRKNGPPSYGHCEATLYLRIREGHYGKVALNGVRLIDTGGACSMRYEKLSALYFDQSASAEQQAAMLKLIAGMFTGQAADFPYVRVVAINGNDPEDRVVRVSIPGMLEMAVDKNWGRATPPFPWVAAVDHFANSLQYVQNLRYEIHDPAAAVDFDYSRRQANYRIVDLGYEQYLNKRMLIQYQDGSGQLNEAQVRLARELGLTLPDDNLLGDLVKRIRSK